MPPHHTQPLLDLVDNTQRLHQALTTLRQLAASLRREYALPDGGTAVVSPPLPDRHYYLVDRFDPDGHWEEQFTARDAAEVIVGLAPWRDTRCAK